MNWGIILKYCIILFIATAIVAFPFGFIHGILASRGYADHPWLTIVQGIAVLLVSIIVFARLAYIQRAKPLYHALLVGLLCWLISFPVNVGFLHLSIRNWALSVIGNLIIVGIGVPIGNFMGQKRMSNNSTT